MATFSAEPARTDRGARMCEAKSKRTGLRCKAPAVGGDNGLGVCQWHGGATKTSKDKIDSNKRRAEREAFLNYSGFFNPHAVEIEDPVVAFARHAGQALWQYNFLGNQLNISGECECCGRADFDPTLMREMRAISKELGTYLDAMIKHRVYNRALDLEQAKVEAIYKGLAMVLNKVLGEKCNDGHLRAGERIFIETVEPLIRQIEVSGE